MNALDWWAKCANSLRGSLRGRTTLPQERADASTALDSGITELQSVHPDGTRPLTLGFVKPVFHLNQLEQGSLIVTDVFTDGSTYITLEESGKYCTFITEKGSIVHLNSETMVCKGDNGFYHFAQKIE